MSRSRQITDTANETEKAGDSVRAVERALDVLLAFKGADAGLTVAEVLKRVDLSRPTLYRLLRTLEGKGFVVASGDPQRFRLGSAIAQLVHSWNTSLKLTDIAEPTMRRVWEATEETVALFVPDGLMRLCVAELESSQALSYKRGVGYRERLLLGASGRAILARMDADLDLRPYADGLALDIAKSRMDIDEVRKTGYAISRDELIQGAVAIAAPIVDASNQVVGSLGIFGPSVRLPESRAREYGRMLLLETDSISTALGRQPAL